MKKTHYSVKCFLTAICVFGLMSSCQRDDTPLPEIPPSDGTSMKLNGGEGGSSAENTVFVDLSTDKQHAVNRTQWNLGFYNGDEFRVILNNTAGSSAVKVEATDLTKVSEDDVDLSTLSIALGSPGAFSNIDDLTGDLGKTIIPAISATEAENKVFILNPIGGVHGKDINAADLFKLRIIRKGNDYELLYARLNATEFERMSIKKNDDFNFQYISFTDGPVAVEPIKKEWDFQWTWSLYFGSMPDGSNFPYGYSDLIFINYLAGVSAAEIVFKNADGSSNGQPAYADFGEIDLTGITFNTSKGAISSAWRKTTGTPLGVQTDRYYLIKDPSGNIYKLRFTSMGAGNPPVDGGMRGYPEIEYKLVKRG